MHRSINVHVDNPKDYFLITLYDTFLSHVVSELKDRFNEESANHNGIALQQLLPGKCCDIDSSGLLQGGSAS